MKALLISRDEELQTQLSLLAASHAVPVALSMTGDSINQACGQIAAESPHLVIIDASLPGETGFGLVEALGAQYPHIAFMLLTHDQSPELLLRAMRAGVREVITLPVEPDSFLEALGRVTHKMTSTVRQAKIISFIPCKGGSGATFIAANLAYALAAQVKKKVLLIDFNQQFGDAAMYVSEKKPSMTLADVCAQINRIDAAFLESSLISVAPNFGVLAASDDPTHAGSIVTGAHVDTLLALARNYYDFILLDLGRQIDAPTIRALDQSDLIYPVMQLGLPHVRDAGRLLDIFKSLGYRRDKTHIIVNRYEKSSGLRLSDLENAIGGENIHTMPNNYKAANDSINQGVPILQLARHSAVSRRLVEMVDDLVGWKTEKEPGLVMRLFQNRVQASIAQV